MSSENDAAESMKQLLRSYIGKEPQKQGPEIPPVSKWLNGILKEVEDESLAVEIEVRPELTNPAGFLHGGVQAAIIDELMGMTVFMISSNMHVSANLYIDYLSKARVGDKITARSRIIRKGRSITNLECVLVNEEGTIVTRGVSNFCRVNAPAPFP